MAAERIESQVPMVQRRTLTITPTLDLYAAINQNVHNVGIWYLVQGYPCATDIVSSVYPLEVSRIQLRFLKDVHPLVLKSCSDVEGQYIHNG